MHFAEARPSSQQIAATRRTHLLESTRSQHYKKVAADWQEERPEAAIQRVLLALLRRQTRKPFQLLKQFFLFSEDEPSIEVGYKHSRL